MPLFEQVQIRDEGVVQGFVMTMDFVGAGVAVAVAGGVATVTISGSGNTIYSGDGTIAGARAVALNSNAVAFNQGAEPFLKIDPTANAETTFIRAFNTTGGDNYGRVVTSTSSTNAQAYLEASFNGSAQIGGILLIADATSARLTYTAATHTFTGGVSITGDIDVATVGTRWGSQSFGASGEFPACALIGSFSGSVTIFPSYSTVTAGSKVIIGYWSGAVRSAFEVANVASGNGVAYIMKTGGNVGIGVSSTTARLHLPAGSATASTGPLKFTSGTLLGTTEAGAIEYDGTHLYFTAANAGTRYQLDQQGGGVTIYSGDGALAGNRVVNLDGHSLSFSHGGNYFVKIDPTTNAEGLEFRAYNITGASNKGAISLTSTDLEANVFLEASFDGGSKYALIAANAQTSSTSLSYTANIHTFFTPSDGNPLLVISADSGLTKILAYNSTGGGNQASMEFLVDSSSADFFLSAAFDGGADVAIEGFNDGVDKTLEYSADTHTFTGNVGIGGGLLENLFQVVVGSNKWISVDAPGFKTSVSTSDGTADASIQVNSDLADSDVNFYFNANTGSNFVEILGDAVAETITLTSVTTIVSNLAGTGSRAVLADATGALSAPISDLSVKENVMDLTYGLDVLCKLRPVSFSFKDEWKRYGEGMQIGFIAQEIEGVLPNSVFTTPSNGKMGYNETDIIPILVKAVQDQQAHIERLEKQISMN